MKSKIFKTVIVLFTAATFLFGSTNSGATKLLKQAKELSKKAFLKYNVQLFQQSAGLCERVLSAEPNNAEAKYYLAYNQYRILTILIENNSNAEINNYSNSAIKNLKAISGINNYKSEAKTLLAAIYMMKLSEDQSEAPAISTKIYSLLGQAESYNNSNPRIYLIKGIMLFNTPKMFGGSAVKAIDNFNKAISLYKNKNQNPIKWGYLETLAWKGQALTRLKKYSEAETVYNNALKIESNFGWVKYNLLPALLEQKNKANTTITTDSVDVAQINILIKGLNNNQGVIRIALYNSEDNYSKGKFFKNAKPIIDNKTSKYNFKNIPFGTYAIKFYHDENGNGRLDKNFFGMPTEDYGFSNNATGNFGPASFEDAKFTVNKKLISMEMVAQ